MNWLYLILFTSFLGLSQGHAAPFGKSFLVPSPEKTFQMETIADVQKYASFQHQVDIAIQDGMQPLSENWGDPSEYHSSVYLVQNDSFNTYDVRRFLSALADQKLKLMKIYQLKNSTYNKLAAMAFGILGVESKFGDHWFYEFKENHQDIINRVKHFEGKSSVNSRGLTQMKAIPSDIAKNYPQISSETLYDPQHAAVATMGFLAETLRMLRALKEQRHLTYITDENIFDYVPYIYNGRMKKLFKSPSTQEGATVIDNNYILEMRQHMRWLFFMELP